MYLIYSIEEDKDISKIINKTLTKQGYRVESFYNGKDFFESLRNEVPQMILLDMMLPDYSGSEILKIVRNNKMYDDVSIIIISANRMVMDKVDGLDLGADDYIEKPFNILELMSRVNSKFRRLKQDMVYEASGITININKHSALFKGKNLDLTMKEFEILAILVQNKGNVVSREDILNKIWKESNDLQSRTVDMHIKSIRKKLKDDSLIQTIYGIGYKVV